jgi:hypothetical protein
MNTDAVRRDLGEILAHGEPEHGMGQGEAAEQPAGEAADEVAEASAPAEHEVADDGRDGASGQGGNGVVKVDFGGVGPEAA